MPILEDWSEASDELAAEEEVPVGAVDVAEVVEETDRVGMVEEEIADGATCCEDCWGWLSEDEGAGGGASEEVEGGWGSEEVGEDEGAGGGALELGKTGDELEVVTGGGGSTEEDVTGGGITEVVEGWTISVEATGPCAATNWNSPKSKVEIKRETPFDFILKKLFFE